MYLSTYTQIAGTVPFKTCKIIFMHLRRRLHIHIDVNLGKTFVA
jgi:hypothetical protein